MDRQLDVVFIHPGSGPIYQDLRNLFSAVEPPTWSLLLAQSCRRAGYGVSIIDQDAESLSDEEVISHVRVMNPRFVVFAVYGSEPNQGTARMASAVPLAQKLKEAYPEYKIVFCGSHSQALPFEVLALDCVDYVFTNEGVYPLRQLLNRDMIPMVMGLGWKSWPDDTIHEIMPKLNKPANTVRQEDMDRDLPGYAWDLLPHRVKPLDTYRSHFWHSGYRHQNRTPFAAIYTSLGCRFKCSFCMINSINRNSNAPSVTAADSAGMRWWSAEHTFIEFDKLLLMGVRTIRISDEMFFLDKRHYIPIIYGLIQRNTADDLNLWAYARVDTVRPEKLELFRKAGIRWLALGVESGNPTIRRENSKGSFEDVDVRKVFKEIEEAGIHPICNVIFGLPGDTEKTMEETLSLAIELNAPMFNCYPAMALPGSPLYMQAKKEGRKLPDSYAGYGFLSYECQPLGTEFLSPEEVLEFRDAAFLTYYGRSSWQDKIARLFGPEAKENIRKMLQIKLQRKLLVERRSSPDQINLALCSTPT